MLGIEEEVVRAVLEDWKTAPVDERFRAALKLTEAITRTPQDIDRRFVADLFESGLDNDSIEEIASVGFQFNFINRVADSVNFPIPDPDQQSRLARVLNLMARIITGGQKPSPSWTRCEDGLIRPTELESARNELFSNKGSLDKSTRIAIESKAASLRGAKRVIGDLPNDIEKLVETLSLSAYKIYDEMVEEIKTKGWSDRELFEVVLISSFGAAVAANEFLFEALYGEGNGDEG